MRRGGIEIDVARGEINRCLEAALPKNPCHAPLRSTSESATRLAAPSSRMEAGWGGEARRHLFCDCCISNCQNSSTHSGSNTNHLGSISNGQSCIHLSLLLLCCLIESCDMGFALQLIPSVPMACGLFGFLIMYLQRSGQWTLFFQKFSFDNVLLFVFTRRLQIPKFRISSSLVMQFQNSALISTLRAHSQLQITALNQSHRIIPEIIARRDCPVCHELRFVCI